MYLETKYNKCVFKYFSKYHLLLSVFISRLTKSDSESEVKHIVVTGFIMYNSNFIIQYFWSMCLFVDENWLKLEIKWNKM